MLKEFGRDLKNLRESKGISIAEISAQTRINPKFLTNFEEGIFDFQPDTYTRAFLREYARCLNEDEHKLLNDYEKAKSGFYARKSGGKSAAAEKKIKEDQVQSTNKPLEERTEKKFSEQTELKSSYQEEGVYERINGGSPNGSLNKNTLQKFFVGVVVVLVIASAVYLLFFLNNSDDSKTDVKPQKFSETVNSYDTKVNKRTSREQEVKKENKQIAENDSLKLTIWAARDVRIKVYIDENHVVEDIIPAKDSMTIKAKDGFRFSASANSSIELYLNGSKLKKPSTLTGTTIKNLMINKDGIVSE